MIRSLIEFLEKITNSKDNFIKSFEDTIFENNIQKIVVDYRTNEGKYLDKYSDECSIIIIRNQIEDTLSSFEVKNIKGFKIFNNKLHIFLNEENLIITI